MGIVFASILLLLLIAFIKWSHFIELIAIPETINRWGIRILGAGPNSEMTVLILLSLTWVAAHCLANVAVIIKSAKES